jgi:magnesium transporter
MGSHQVPISRELEPAEIGRLREAGEFFWADLAAEAGPPSEQVAAAFGLSEGARRTLFDFEEGGSPARRIHVEETLVVFAFWCSADPEPADALGGGESLRLFRVNVCLHGDFLLTVHERAFDLPGTVAPGGIPAGRTERYAVYVALEGMTATLIEALGDVEREIAGIESQLLDAGTRGPGRDDQAIIRSLRSRLTTLRMRIAAARGLFGRVGEEIEHVPSLEADREVYFERIEGELDRAVDRVDAASSALSHMLDVQLNGTTFRLTVIATIFLPLTFLTGFFGMNFGWLVDHIDSAAAFWLLGVGLMTGPLLLVLALLRGGDAAERLQRLGRKLVRGSS